MRRQSSDKTQTINESLHFHLLTACTIQVRHGQRITNAWCVPTSTEAHAQLLVHTWRLPCNVESLLDLLLRFKQQGMLHCSKKPSKHFSLQFSLLRRLRTDYLLSFGCLFFFVFILSVLDLQFLSHPLRFPSSNFQPSFLSAANVTGA